MERRTRRDVLLGGLAAAAIGLTPNESVAQDLSPSHEKRRIALAQRYLESGEATPEFFSEAVSLMLTDHFHFFALKRFETTKKLPTEVNPQHEWNTFVTRMRDALNRVRTQIPPLDPLFALKKSLESVLPSLVYNKDATSVYDLLLNNRTQCSSGTLTMILASHALAEASPFFQNAHMQLVMVYTDTHVQPGYWLQTPHGEELIMVESTALGETQHRHTLTELSASPVRIVVMDARHEIIQSVLPPLSRFSKINDQPHVRRVFGPLSNGAFRRDFPHGADFAPNVLSNAFVSGAITVPSGDQPLPRFNPQQPWGFPYLRTRERVPSASGG